MYWLGEIIINGEINQRDNWSKGKLGPAFIHLFFLLYPLTKDKFAKSFDFYKYLFGILVVLQRKYFYQNRCWITDDNSEAL